MTEKIRAWKKDFNTKVHPRALYWLDQAKLAINDYGYVIMYEHLDKLRKIKARSGYRRNWNEVRSLINWVYKIDPWAIKPLYDCYFRLLAIEDYRKKGKSNTYQYTQIEVDEKFYCESMWNCIRIIVKKYDKAKVKYDNATSLQEVI